VLLLDGTVSPDTEQVVVEGLLGCLEAVSRGNFGVGDVPRPATAEWNEIFRRATASDLEIVRPGAAPSIRRRAINGLNNFRVRNRPTQSAMWQKCMAFSADVVEDAMTWAPAERDLGVLVALHRLATQYWLMDGDRTDPESHRAVKASEQLLSMLPRSLEFRAALWIADIKFAYNDLQQQAPSAGKQRWYW
jgi:hypothetical protein